MSQCKSEKKKIKMKGQKDVYPDLLLLQIDQGMINTKVRISKSNIFEH